MERVSIPRRGLGTLPHSEGPAAPVAGSRRSRIGHMKTPCTATTALRRRRPVEGGLAAHCRYFGSNLNLVSIKDMVTCEAARVTTTGYRLLRASAMGKASGSMVCPPPAPRVLVRLMLGLFRVASPPPRPSVVPLSAPVPIVIRGPRGSGARERPAADPGDMELQPARRVAARPALVRRSLEAVPVPPLLAEPSTSPLVPMPPTPRRCRRFTSSRRPARSCWRA